MKCPCGACRMMRNKRTIGVLVVAVLLAYGCLDDHMKPAVQERKSFFAQKADIPNLREDFLRQKAAQRSITYEQALAADQGMSTARPPIRPDDRAVVRAGREIFENLCARCHGTDLRGWGDEGYSVDKVDLMRKDRVSGWGDAKWARYFKTVSKGKIVFLQDPMPAFEKYLAREQIWQVIAYVRHVQLNEDLHW